MLSGVKLDRCFWAKVVDTACYSINGSHCLALTNKTPYEVWIGRNLSDARLRVFGCEDFVYVPQEKQSKLDPKAHKCIFVDYNENIKGYNIWNPLTQKMIISKDLIFKEFRAYLDEEQPKEKTKTMHFEKKIGKNEDYMWNNKQMDLRMEKKKRVQRVKMMCKMSIQRKMNRLSPLLLPFLELHKATKFNCRYRPPNFYHIFIFLSTDNEPRSFREALSLEESKSWMQAHVGGDDGLRQL